MRVLPEFRELTTDECETVLARNHVCRIAYSFHDRVDIEPIHYVYGDGKLYARTSPGSKVVTLRHNRWVAFEVDEVDGVFDWRSVVAHGTVEVLTAENADPAAWHEALRLLRRVVPHALTPRDPVPSRSVVLRIHVNELSGREASSGINR